MSGITLGLDPAQVTVVLSNGYPFAATLIRTLADKVTPEDWPAAPTLTFSDDSTWVATITTNVAAFTKTSGEVAAKLALTDRKVALSVGGVLWARGVVAAK